MPSHQLKATATMADVKRLTDWNKTLQSNSCHAYVRGSGKLFRIHSIGRSYVSILTDSGIQKIEPHDISEIVW